MSDFWTSALDRFGLEDPFAPDKSAKRMREALRAAAPHIDVKAPPLEEVSDLSIPGPGGDIPARLYIPNASVAPAPLLVFFHGGGFMVGDLETHDRLCRRLAAKSGVRVLAVDYRLSPEHAHPAAIQDARAAFDWAAGEGAGALGADPERLAVGGDSAGGNLTAIIAQERRERLRFQLLIYPLMQLAEIRKPKMKMVEGHMLSVTALNQIREAYLPGFEDFTDPAVSPLFRDDLVGLPPAYIALAELDPLRDEGEAYAKRLEASGVPVELVMANALPHGYFSATAILPGAKEKVNRAAAALGDALPD
jgi:acetyl esterase